MKETAVLYVCVITRTLLMYLVPGTWYKTRLLPSLGLRILALQLQRHPLSMCVAHHQAMTPPSRLKASPRTVAITSVIPLIKHATWHICCIFTAVWEVYTAVVVELCTVRLLPPGTGQVIP